MDYQMKNWVTSDYHLDHHNIIKYCNRPFSDGKHMTDTIISNHNSRVRPGDTVFHLGDFCFKLEGSSTKSWEWEQQLNGKIIHVRGNHDRNNSTRTCIEKVELWFGGFKIIMGHYPDHPLAEFFDITLHGHVQNKKPQIWEDQGNTFFNASCDVHQFMPITLDEMIGMVRKYKNKKGRE